MRALQALALVALLPAGALAHPLASGLAQVAAVPQAAEAVAEVLAAREAVRRAQGAGQVELRQAVVALTAARRMAEQGKGAQAARLVLRARTAARAAQAAARVGDKGVALANEGAAPRESKVAEPRRPAAEAPPAPAGSRKQQARGLAPPAPRPTPPPAAEIAADAEDAVFGAAEPPVGRAGSARGPAPAIAVDEEEVLAIEENVERELPPPEQILDQDAVFEALKMFQKKQ